MKLVPGVRGEEEFPPEVDIEVTAGVQGEEELRREEDIPPEVEIKVSAVERILVEKLSGLIEDCITGIEFSLASEDGIVTISEDEDRFVKSSSETDEALYSTW